MKDEKQVEMNNKDKAMEIAGCFTCNDPFCYVRFSEGQENSGCNRFRDALEMAKWKDEEFEKRKKKIRDNLIKLLHSRGLMR